LESEGVKQVTASVYGVSEHIKLLEHSLICDLPHHGLLDDDLCSEQDPLEAIIHIQCRLLGALADEEMYASSG
jgi:hypothetical protein